MERRRRSRLPAVPGNIFLPQGVMDQKWCVAPHPDLQEKILKDLASLRKRAHGIAAPFLKVQLPPRVGFNDGLLLPGDRLPLGSPPSMAKGMALDRAPLRGAVKVIVVLVDFGDQAMTQSRQHFNDLFFSTGVLANGSLREYYTEVSHGLVTITGEVVGPYHMPRTMAQYANGASGIGNTNPSARDMAYDAAVASNPDVNFTPYDNDGDGFVDAYVVIHAGPGAEVTGNADHIWSHKWVLRSAYNADSAQIYAYLTVPEDARVGVCAHELGHLLFGWPDLYDTDYSSSGIGNWCLMAGGSWNGGGDIPSHPSAWCKSTQGWVSVTNQTTNQSVTIHDVKTNHEVFRLWKDGNPSSEYFLIENRQRTLFDRNIPGDGLIVYHVDETIASNSNEAHPRVALMQADGLKQLEAGINRGDAGDPFPGSANKTEFDGSTNPSSKSYGDAETCVAVTRISASAGTMTARLAVRCVVKLKERGKDKLEKERMKTEKLEKERIKELKDRIKDSKERKEFKEKDLKDVKERKEFKEKDQKDVVEKPTDKPLGTQGVRTSTGIISTRIEELAARVEALEGIVANLEPFIGTELRPDLTYGALANEEDVEQLREDMVSSEVDSKRLMDTKLPER